MLSPDYLLNKIMGSYPPPNVILLKTSKPVIVVFLLLKKVASKISHGCQRKILFSEMITRTWVTCNRFYH